MNERDKINIERLKENFEELGRVFESIANYYADCIEQLGRISIEIYEAYCTVEEKERLRQRNGRDKDRNTKVPDRRRLAALQDACLKHNGTKTKKRQYTRHRMEKKDFKSRTLSH